MRRQVGPLVTGPALALRNGATILRSEQVGAETVVLAQYQGEYVTWLCRQGADDTRPGLDAFWPRYHRDAMARAETDFAVRVRRARSRQVAASGELFWASPARLRAMSR